ncbi:MAG: cystathionine beta-lyase [Bacteroidetes bacterium RBG_13_43_22]|nr:MAG: cystathionine beta-lyase [Bacteroidetes bacterium RBG_13_43_22]
MRWNFDEEVRREGTDCIKYDLRQEVFGRGDVIPMWVADMDFKTPGFITDKLRNRLDKGIFGYSFRPVDYYGSIIKWFKSRHNWRIEKEWICFCPGIVPALNICTLAFTRPGDSIIVQPPVYFPFFSAVENHGRNLVFNQLAEKNSRWEMDLESLVASIDEHTKMIIISNPHNPVGRVWSAEELSKLAEICLENEIIILSDEIHCDLILPGFCHTPTARISDKISEITVTCIAPSKTFNLAGLTTASVIIPNPVLRKYFNKKIEDIHIGNGNIFGTIASTAAYSEGHDWLSALMDYIDQNVEIVLKYCRELVPEIVPVQPEATFMIWLDCRKLGMTGKEVQNFFVEKAGIGLNEGSTFGPGGEGFMRMNVATTRNTVIRALEQIEKAVARMR